MAAFTNLTALLTHLTTNVSASDTPNPLNRYAGGHHKTTQPYVSGYWYLLMRPPAALFSKGNNVSTSSTWLQSTAESFTPPTKTITKVDVPGMGGVASSFAAGQELSRTFTIAFREYQGLPIMNILQTWTNVIDSRSGMSPTLNFSPVEYKGDCYVALCRPTIDQASHGITNSDIEQLFHFEGVFPETLPYDTLTSDIATNDSAQLSVTFSFDGWPTTLDHPGTRTSFLEAATANNLNGIALAANSLSIPSVKQAVTTVSNFFA